MKSFWEQDFLSDSPLYKQLDNKLRLLDTAIKNIKENIEFIQQENRPGENTIMVSHGKKQTYLELFSKEIHASDIREFSNFGLRSLLRLNNTLTSATVIRVKRKNQDKS